MPDLLLTGGTGFFGKSLLAANLFPKDLRIFPLSRSGEIDPARFPELSGLPGVTFLKGDVRTMNLSGRKFDYVIHAAAPSGGGATEEEMYSILTDGTRNLLENLRGSGVGRLLYVSSGAVYGTQEPETERMDESHPLRPDTLYGKGKLEAERMCLESGIPCVIARCFAFIGRYLPRDAHFAAGNFLGAAERNLPEIVVKGDGRPYRSYLYADDLAAWLVKLLFEGVPGEAYNVGSEESVTIRELAETTANLRNPPLKVTVGEAPGAGPAPRYVPDTAKIRRAFGLPEPRRLAVSLRILLPEEGDPRRDEWLALDDEALSAQCSLDFHKASGHGGQHVNKTSSAVRVVHRESGFSAVCSERRSQHENRRIALALLRERIALGIRRKPDPMFRAGVSPVSRNSRNYPLFEAKLLDVFAGEGAALKPAANRIGTGTTKLVKLFYRDTALWGAAQAMRGKFGLAPLSPPENAK